MPLNTSYLDNLKACGLNDKQARVYLACLELGRSTVSKIAKIAGINRTTAYDILSGLVQKNLISISGKEPKEEYNAESPVRLVRQLERESERIKTQVEQYRTLLPELQSIYGHGKRPQVRFYEGIEGLKEIYENTLESKTDIRAFASVEDTTHSLPGYFPKYFQRRAAKKIKMRAIFPSTIEAKTLSKQNKAHLRESRLVDKDKYGFSPQIDIYDNKVMICSWKEQLGIVIESGEIADAMKKVFELAWKGSKDAH